MGFQPAGRDPSLGRESALEVYATRLKFVLSNTHLGSMICSIHFRHIRESMACQDKHL